MIAVAVALVAVTRPSPDSAPPGGASGGVRATCVAAAGADPSADLAILRTRASQISGGSVSLAVAGTRITADLPGAKRDDVATFCASTTLQLRPLIAPVVVTNDTTAFPADLPLPASEQEYDRLTPAQRLVITDHLRTATCPAQSATAQRPMVACTAQGAQRMAALVGPAVVNPDGITGASPVAPSAETGALDWSIAVRLDDAAAADLSAYTTAHNSGEQQTGELSRCGSASTPCADYMASVVNGTILVLPLTLAPLAGGVLQLSGGMDRAAAQRLAAALSSDPLPVPLRSGAVTT